MTPKTLLVRLVLLPFIIHLFQLLNVVKVIIFFIIKIFTKKVTLSVVRTPEERFEGLQYLGYKFAPHFVQLQVGGGKTLPRVHYVDEGPRDAKETILCLHGEPSWSFLYRKMVPVLVAAGYRVIVPDFIGFGKSDKYTHPERYTHELHTMTVRLLLDHTEATNVTLICQDWGGLTGLTVVKDSPQFFSRLVIMNTGLPIGFSLTPSTISVIPMITPFLTWRAFVELFETYLPIGRVFKLAMKDVSSEVLAAYCAPFPSAIYKAGAARWPLMVPVTKGSLVSTEMKETRDFLQNKWSRPALIMFSNDDPITGQEVHAFRKLLPRAKQVTINGGGHFLQEEKGQELAENVVKFIDGTN